MSDAESVDSDTKKRKGENYEIFRKSKKTERSPAREDKRRSETDIMEICKQMLEEIKQVRKDQKEMRKELEDSNNETRTLRDAITAINQKWEQKYEEMENKFQKLEKRMENLEKEKRKNNIVVTGMNIDVKDEVVEKKMEEWLNTELGVETKVKEVKRITQNKILVSMENFDKKLGILRSKTKLKGKKIYIDSDLTSQERDIQRKLRQTANKLREEGKSVKIGHMKLIGDGKEMLWNEKEKAITAKITKN